jgi:hypothetical protein
VYYYTPGASDSIDAKRRQALTMPSRLLISLAAAVILAAFASHDASAAMSWPAHSNKGRGKGKSAWCRHAKQCNLATRADVDSIKTGIVTIAGDVSNIQAHLDLVGTTIDAVRGYLRTTSSFTTGLVTMGGPEECDPQPASDGFSAVCRQDLWSPRTVKSITDCPPGFEMVVQTDCWGWSYDQAGNWVGPLPVYESGAITNTAFCRLGTDNLPDGFTAEIIQFVMCSHFRGEGVNRLTPGFSATEEERLSKAKSRHQPPTRLSSP